MSRRKPTLGEEFVGGGLAGALSCVFTNPLEVVKVRLQLQGELQKKLPPSQRTYRSILQTLRVMVVHEGIRSVQKGLGAACGYQVLMNGMRLGMYRPLQRFFDVHPHETGKNMLIGAATGVMGAVMANPFYMIKTRLQAQSSYAEIGHQYAYRGTFDAAATIVRQEGFVGLYRGVGAMTARIIVGSAVQLAAYDRVKHLLLGWGMPNDARCHIAASMLTGVVTVTAANPFDVVRTRMYAQQSERGQGGVVYRGVIDCFAKVLRAEGIHGLYKGWASHWLRLGPHTVLTFTFWEALQRGISRLRADA
jgi:solute carrier family 25 protein 34/35